MRPRRVGFVRVHGGYKIASVSAWQELDGWMERHDLKSQISCGYGLWQEGAEAGGTGRSRYDACVETPDGYENLKSDGLLFQSLPGGAFARIRHIGAYSKIKHSVEKVRDKWLPDQPRLLIDRRRPQLVVYLDDPNTRDATKLRCDVCIPVRTHHDDVSARSKMAQALAESKAAVHA